jgi:hypothetical protein
VARARISVSSSTPDTTPPARRRLELPGRDAGGPSPALFNRPCLSLTISERHCVPWGPLPCAARRRRKRFGVSRNGPAPDSVKLPHQLYCNTVRMYVQMQSAKCGFPPKICRFCARIRAWVKNSVVQRRLARLLGLLPAPRQALPPLLRRR